MTGNKPVRRVVRRTNRRVTGLFPSRKTGRMVQWESQLERDFVYGLEFDPTVIEYREQPFTIDYALDDGPHRYTPDFLIRRADGLEVAEVKPADIACQPDNVRRFEVFAAFFTARGQRFNVYDEREIRAAPRLENLRLLHRYGRDLVPRTLVERVAELLRSRGRMRLGDLLAALSNPAAPLSTGYALIATGLLVADLSTALGHDTVVHRSTDSDEC